MTGVQTCALPIYDFDRVLVRAHGAVGPEAVKEAADALRVLRDVVG